MKRVNARINPKVLYSTFKYRCELTDTEIIVDVKLYVCVYFDS